MHVDDIDKYEGPPCEMCRTSQFIGTCTHRPRKVQWSCTFGNHPEGCKCYSGLDHSKECKGCDAWSEKMNEIRRIVMTIDAEADKQAGADGFIEGYTVKLKTGWWHKLLGMIRS